MNRLFNCARKVKEQAQRYKRDIFQKPKRGTAQEKVYNEERNFNILARRQVEKMRDNIAKNTPKIVAGLLLGSSLPQLYFYYQSMWLEYTDSRYYENIKKSLDYFNMKNAFFCASICGLQVVKYCDIKATKRALPPRGNVFMWLLMPIGFSFATLSFWDVIDKKMLVGSYFCDASLLFVETKLVSEAVLPFWFFNLKYTAHIFDIVYLTCIYFSMKNLRNYIDKMPHKFMQQSEQNLNPLAVLQQLNESEAQVAITEKKENIKTLPSILSLQKKL
ncbi:transmembrane protein, putative (macronuclear) [Tetrahymena thermophila SB210]|uniref:Transmembrane protein, putative n=1 Tax=Tetrahymena thermophila (strain SB210) TaxID=312017 RepID=Q234K0_TETTS|nr:transmembrane protein, putative [Tetrahymena thermophila SB210]EAR92003.1 transmembrane protein, putative [Tetrahymena thermophila SB210]|eukprot:XP_001012248.1 transmembrane protein, putative [Tetrahymena thermophila SB210]